MSKNDEEKKTIGTYFKGIFKSKSEKKIKKNILDTSDKNNDPNNNSSSSNTDEDTKPKGFLEFTEEKDIKKVASKIDKKNKYKSLSKSEFLHLRNESKSSLKSNTDNTSSQDNRT